jgi:hypothetical protein
MSMFYKLASAVLASAGGRAVVVCVLAPTLAWSAVLHSTAAADNLIPNASLDGPYKWRQAGRKPLPRSRSTWEAPPPRSSRGRDRTC